MIRGNIMSVLLHLRIWKSMHFYLNFNDKAILYTSSKGKRHNVITWGLKQSHDTHTLLNITETYLRKYLQWNFS